MKKIYYALFFILCTGITYTATGQAINDILERHAQARGGSERLEAINSVQFRGEVILANQTAEFTMAILKPDYISLRVNMGSDIVIEQKYDGETAWLIQERNGEQSTMQMSPVQSLRFKSQADITGPLINPDQKGVNLRYEGISNDFEEPLHKIRVNYTNEERYRNIYLDIDSYLTKRETSVEKIESPQNQPGTESFMRIETVYDEYQTVEGIVLPASITTYIDRERLTSMTITEFQINPPTLSPADFKVVSN